MNILDIEFEYDGFFWMGGVTLPSWTGYSCLSPENRSLSNSISIILIAESEDIEPDPEFFKKPLSYLLEHEETLHQLILERALYDYDDEAQLCGYFAEHDDLSNPKDKKDIKKFIAPNVIYIHQNKAGLIYRFGFSFSCRWDEEHGYGLVFEDGKIVETGYSGCAFEG